MHCGTAISPQAVHSADTRAAQVFLFVLLWNISLNMWQKLSGDFELKLLTGLGTS